LIPVYNAKSAQSMVWDESVFLPRKELGELHLRRIQRLMKYAYDKVPFYRKLYDDAGIKPQDIKTLRDFQQKVPRFDKPELLLDQEQSDHQFGLTAMDPSFGTYYYETSGTTGRSYREISTFYDIYATADSWVHSWWHAGMRPGDGMYFCFNFQIFAGFWTAYRACERLGITIYSGSGLSTEQRVRDILRLKPTAIIGTPTYLLRLIDTAQKMAIDLSQSSLRFAAGAGETGGNVPLTRKQIIDGLGLVTYCDQYGISDLMWGTSECCTHSGGVHVNEMFFYSYSIDPETNEMIDTEGAVGENVVTGYNRWMQPMINYRTHDLVRRFQNHNHGCGWTWDWLKGAVLGRTDYMVTIRGTNVYQSAIEHLIGHVPGLSVNYEIHLCKENNMDRIDVKVESKENRTTAEYFGMKKQLEETYHENLKVKIGVEVVPPQTFPRYELKTKRIFDRRNECV
jgi:phenylacetate-CoA ligase